MTSDLKGIGKPGLPKNVFFQQYPDILPVSDTYLLSPDSQEANVVNESL